MAERMVTLLRYQDPDQAIFYTELLENAGIPVEIVDQREMDEDEVPEAPALPGEGGRVLLQVPESRAEERGKSSQKRPTPLAA
ncbi:MAG: hypothetical protein IT368_15260 [Candidatus Hydrogenedentes bacterium]|nr:hypothetical protein [Candidatus Hydrogenedentota bacterium]